LLEVLLALQKAYPCVPFAKASQVDAPSASYVILAEPLILIPTGLSLKSRGGGRLLF